MPDTPPPALTPELQQRMLRRLRFDAELEQLFRRQLESTAIVSRVTLQIVSALLIAVTPMYDRPLLNAPPDFLPTARLLQFGLEVPVVLLALLFTAWPRLRRASGVMTGLAGVVVAAALTGERVLAAPYGFVVPHDLAAITLAAVLFIGRLRLVSFLPWALLTMVGTTTAELLTFRATEVGYGIISAWMLFVMAAIGAYALEFSTRQSWYRGLLLEFQATRDPLTGLPNRRHFDLQLRELIRDAARQRKNVALLLLDVDHFKAYNDHYGHPSGDECLRRISARLRLSIRRPRDFCARIGGEEFAAVWFDAGPADSVQLAEQLRLSIGKLGIPAAPDKGGDVTASGGFVQVLAPSPADTPERIAVDLMKAADGALYEAKRTGRARLVIAGGARAKAAPPAG